MLELCVLADQFCISHYWLAIIGTIGIIAFHPLFRKAQRIHAVLMRISQLDAASSSVPTKGAINKGNQQYHHHHDTKHLIRQRSTKKYINTNDRDIEFFRLIKKHIPNNILSQTNFHFAI